MLVALLAEAIKAAAPLLFATVGGILCERSGHLNLGIEGMMLMGAVTGFSIGLASNSPILALLGAMVAGGIGGLIYAIITVSFMGNQVVTGLSLSIFGIGYANFIGSFHTKGGFVRLGDAFTSLFGKMNIPGLSDIPFIGRLFFQFDIMVYIAFAVAILAGIYLYKTRPGQNLRAVGEHPGAADAAGISIIKYKYIHIVAGGMLCGLAGAYYSLVDLGTWKNDITSGAGWIAVALIIFSKWNPYKAMYASILFGGLRIFYLYQNKLGFTIPVNSYFIQMLPYAATIIALVFSSVKKSRKNQAPAALGTGYFREER